MSDLTPADVYEAAARRYVESRYTYPIDIDARPLDLEFARSLARSESFRAAVDVGIAAGTATAGAELAEANAKLVHTAAAYAQARCEIAYRNDTVERLTTELAEARREIHEMTLELAKEAGDCQQPCDPDCEVGDVHCQWAHLPSHKPGWHSADCCPATVVEAGTTMEETT